jgi:hypothetical protein
VNPLIRNLSSFGSCERCDDTGVISLDRVRIYEGHVYDRYAGTCDRCEEGERKRVAWACRRRSWRHDEVAA